MPTPIISVYMITYNHIEYIARAINSILDQKTEFSFEIVIGEDCSTDGTRQVVFQYQEKHPDLIRVITSDQNIGMHKNSVRTIEACRGKYLAFCDGDDYFHDRQKLQKQAKYLEKHPKCGLVHSDQNRYFEEYDLEIENFFRTTNNLPPENLSVFRGWNGYNVLTCTVMTRKELLDTVLTDSNIYDNEKYIGGTDIPSCLSFLEFWNHNSDQALQRL